MAIKDLLRSGHLTNEEIAQETKYNPNTVRQMRARLKNSESGYSNGQIQARRWLLDHNLDPQTHQVEYDQKISRAKLDQTDVDLLNLSLNGYPYDEIAQQCNITLDSVRTRMGRIYQKLEVKRLQAVEILGIRGEIKGKEIPLANN